MAGPVSVVIPNWNGSANLATALSSVKAQEVAFHEVLVVDNGSSDDSVAVAEQAGAQVISLEANYGFARAVNRGIQQAIGDWIVVLNNDVELSPSWLAHLVAAAEARHSWFATGKLLGAPGRIDGTYDAICRGACSWRCGEGRPDGPVWNDVTSICFAPFTAALFRAELFRRVGLLDEDYESYLEDADFGLRCAAAGLSGVYVPTAIGLHKGSATLGRWHPETVRRIARNQLFLVAKHYPVNWAAKYGWPIFIAQGLWGLIALRHGAGLAYLAGKLEGIRSFRKMRRTGSAITVTTIEQSERQILDLQRQTGFDFYWKLYFALT